VFVPAELAVTYEEPEKPNLPSRSSLAKDHFASPAMRRQAQRPGLHHRTFGLCPRDALRTSTLA
jgi:hypothetical protein